MAAEFLRVGAIVLWGNYRATVESECKNGKHRIKLMDGPRKGEVIEAPFTILKLM